MSALIPVLSRTKAFQLVDLTLKGEISRDALAAWSRAYHELDTSGAFVVDDAADLDILRAFVEDTQAVDMQLDGAFIYDEARLRRWYVKLGEDFIVQ